LKNTTIFRLFATVHAEHFQYSAAYLYAEVCPEQMESYNT